MVIFMEKETFLKLDKKALEEILKNNINNTKYNELKKYYEGEHEILNRERLDKNLPNNRLVNNIAKYITDTMTGYFIGRPVVYSSLDEKFMDIIQDIYDYADEQDHNMEIAKNISIYGSSYEMMYIDEMAKIRFALIKPSEIIMIRSTDKKEILGVLRFVEIKELFKESYYKVEFWDDISVKCYKYKQDKLEFIEEREHYFKDVPFVEYINNEERKGDFEGVTSLIDAYNKVQSNTANLFEYNDDAILTISKLGQVSNAEIKQMKEDRCVILDNGGEISWLLKTVDDTAIENYKNRVRDDIHLFTNVPNITDEKFGGNMSGVAISYKLWALEQTTAIKERKFKKGLQRRLELITNILNLFGKFNYMDIEINFRRNKPQNILETAQIINMLSGELSQETKLGMLPNIDDVNLEIEKLSKENEKEVKDYDDIEGIEHNEH